MPFDYKSRVIFQEFLPKALVILKLFSFYKKLKEKIFLIASPQFYDTKCQRYNKSQFLKS